VGLRVGKTGADSNLRSSFEKARRAKVEGSNVIGPWSVKQIGDLADRQSLNATLINDRERRARVPIAIVDDEPFAAQQTLTNHGYDVRPIGDLKSLREIDDFNIILCDLRGVGQNFDQKNQGAYLIDEIKRNHPEKFVIAYTAGAQDDLMARKANEASDVFLRKDADIEEWRNKLDDFIDRLCNPVIVWRRQRDALVRNNVATIDILRLEDAFVRTVEKADLGIFERMANGYDIKPDARAVAQSLVASGIFSLILA